jgi:hypothetical protein
MLLQFILPNVTVEAEDDLEATNPDGTLTFKFKHGNWEDFVRHMDEGLRRDYYSVHQVYPTFGLVWLGKRLTGFF